VPLGLPDIQYFKGAPFATCPGWETIKAAAVLPAAMVAAKYKTNHYTILYAAARSPEVKVTESKVQLQLVNAKYNYSHLHAL